MCPACLTTTALIIAGTTSAGGVAAFLLRKLPPRLGGALPAPGSTGRPDEPRRLQEVAE